MTLAKATFAGSDISINYVPASGSNSASFTASGTASLDFPGSGPQLSLTLGSATAPGLVFSGGALTTLLATTNVSLTLGGVGFTTPSGVTINYATASNLFQVWGSASLAFPGSSNLTLTLGSATSPGMIFSDGALTSLNATTDLKSSFSGATLTATGLNVTYTAAEGTAQDQLTFTGSASLAASIGGSSESISVDLGGGSTAGLVLSGGALQSLNMTVTSNVAVAGVTFDAVGLIITDTISGSSNLFTMTGASNFSVSSIGQVNVDFGGTGTQGLIISNGALTSLNMTVNSSFSVGGVTFTTTNLVMTETVSAQTFTMTGGASLSAGSLADVSVQFGSPAADGNPASTGLVIVGGNLSSLDMTVNSTFTEAGLTFDANYLHFAYNSPSSLVPATYSLSGTCTVGFSGLGNFTVTLGTVADPAGLVIQGSTLVSIGVSISSALNVAGVTLQPANSQDLEFDYTQSSGQYVLSGPAAVTVGNIISSAGGTSTSTHTILAQSVSDSFSASFGTSQNPNGLVVNNGVLSSLALNISGSFTVDGVTFASPSTAPLALNYTAATTEGVNGATSTSGADFQITGSASVTVGNVDEPFTVSFPNNGIDIQNGTLESLDVAISGSLSVNKVTFASPSASPLQIAYTAGQTAGENGATTTTSQNIQITGTASVTVGNMGTFAVDFDKIAIQNDALQTLDVSISGSFKLDSVTFASPSTAPLQLDYTAATTAGVNGATTTAPASYQITGTASVTVTNVGSLTVSFPNNGIDIQGGVLTTLDVSISGSFTVDSVTFASPSTAPLQLDYTAATTAGVNGATTTAPASYQITGTASVTVTNVGSLTVSFPNNGIDIQGGELTSLDVSISGSFTVDSVTFASPSTAPLQLDYTAATTAGVNGATTTAPASYQITGTASVTVTNVGSLTVSFPNNGIDIQGGVLTTLDVSISGSFTVDSVTFASPSTAPLQLDYTAATTAGQNDATVTAPATYQITGSASVSFKSGDSFTVSFPQNGITIVGGALTTLDVAISGSFTEDKVTFSSPSSDPLQFDYTAASGTNLQTFQVTGTAGITLGGITSGSSGNTPGTDSFYVTFGGPLDPQGILVQGGNLVSLDATINSSFWVDGVNIVAKGLEFAYFANLNNSGEAGFEMAGTVEADLPGGIGNVSVTFGQAAGDPGLVVQGGTLISFDMIISASFGVAGVNFAKANLEFTYTSSTDEFTMTGSTTVGFGLAGGQASLTVRPGRDDPGRDADGRDDRQERGPGLAEYVRHGRLHARQSHARQSRLRPFLRGLHGHKRRVHAVRVHHVRLGAAQHLQHHDLQHHPGGTEQYAGTGDRERHARDAGLLGERQHLLRRILHRLPDRIGDLQREHGDLRLHRIRRPRPSTRPAVWSRSGTATRCLWARSISSCRWTVRARATVLLPSGSTSTARTPVSRST